MYGLKNESLIFRLRQPETKIGRHSSNDINIIKSLKVSRFHAVISFLGESLLIKDISEWGVFLNNVPICKHRWAELKLGDVIALGALTREEGGRILEVVAWQSEDKNSMATIRKELEVVDITQDDADDVIDISDDETTIQCNYSSRLPAAHVPEEIIVLSDEEDEVLLLTSPSKSVEPIPKPTTFVELPLKEKVSVSFDENQIDFTTEAVEEKPLVVEAEKEPLVVEMEENPLVLETEMKPLLIDTKPNFIDVTPSMNGLLMKASSSEYPKALHSILNYYSDDDSYSSYDELNNLAVSNDVNLDQKDIKFCMSAENVPPDVKIKPTRRISKKNKVKCDPLLDENVEKIEPLAWSTPKSKQDRQTKYKSPLSVFSKFYDENEENECENEAESDDPPPSPFKVKSEAPIIHRTLLTNKIAKIAIISPLPFVTKRRKRARSESPDTIFQRVTNAERIYKASVSPTSPKLKNSIRESPKKTSTALVVSKNKKALRYHSGTASAQAAVKKQTREKIKVLYPAPPKTIQRTAVTRIQPKVKVTDKNRGDFLTKLNPTTCHQSPSKVVKPKPSKVISSKPIPITKHVEPKDIPTTSYQPPTLTTLPPPIDLKSSPVSSNERRKSIDEILDNIDFNAAPFDNNASEIVPRVTSSRTIEVCVDFTKISHHEVPGSFGKPILKKSIGETQSFGEKKRVTFPRQMVTDFKYTGNDYSKFSFSTMVNKKILPEAETPRWKNQSFKSHNRGYDRTCYENANRIKEKDPRLRSLNVTK